MDGFASIPIETDKFGGVVRRQCGCGCELVQQREISELSPDAKADDDPRLTWVTVVQTDEAKKYANRSPR